jgi:hypothetical protein
MRSLAFIGASLFISTLASPIPQYGRGPDYGPIGNTLGALGKGVGAGIGSVASGVGSAIGGLAAAPFNALGGFAEGLADGFSGMLRLSTPLSLAFQASDSYTRGPRIW